MRLFTRLCAALALACMLAGPLSAQTQTTTVPGTSVTTSGPVTSTTKIETGTLAGQAAMWVAAVFGSTIGAAMTGWLIKMLKLAGINATDAIRARIQQYIINGLNHGARYLAEWAKGKGSIEVRNAIVAHAVEYVQKQAADELKALGADPQSPATVEAIKARIETAIADPMQSTPAVLKPPVVIINDPGRPRDL